MKMTAETKLNTLATSGSGESAPTMVKSEPATRQFRMVMPNNVKKAEQEPTVRTKLDKLRLLSSHPRRRGGVRPCSR